MSFPVGTGILGYGARAAYDPDVVTPPPPEPNPCGGVLFDDFSRTITGGTGSSRAWGNSSSGYIWYVYQSWFNNPTTTVSVNGSEGVIGFPSGGGSALMYTPPLIALASGTFTLTVQVRTFGNYSGSTSEAVEIHLLPGGTPPPSNPGNFVSVFSSLSERDVYVEDGSSNDYFSDGTAFSGTLILKWQRIDGVSSSFKAWEATSTEPPDWIVSTTAEVLSPGPIALGIASTNITKYFDYIDIDYDGMPCTCNQAFDEYSSASTGLLHPAASAVFYVGDQGYNYTYQGSAFSGSSDTAGVSVESGYFRFHGGSGDDAGHDLGIGIGEDGAGYKILEVQTHTVFEAKFRCSALAVQSIDSRWGTDIDFEMEGWSGGYDILISFSNETTQNFRTTAPPAINAPEPDNAHITWQANQWYRIKAVADGPDVRIKLWLDSAAEPSSYTIAADASAPMPWGTTDGGQIYVYVSFDYGYNTGAEAGYNATFDIDYLRFAPGTCA